MISLKNFNKVAFMGTPYFNLEPLGNELYQVYFHSISHEIIKTGVGRFLPLSSQNPTPSFTTYTKIDGIVKKGHILFESIESPLLSTFRLNPEDVKSDKISTFVMEQFLFFDGSIKKDAVFTESMYINAIESNWEAICHIPDSLKSDRVCEIAVKKNWKALFHIPIEQKKLPLCIEALNQNSHALEAVPLIYKTSSLCKEVVTKNWTVIRHVPISLLSDEICKIAINQDYEAICYIPEEVLTPSLCEFAIEKNPQAFLIIPARFKTKQMCILAVEENSSYISFVPDHLLDEEVYMMAIKQDWSLLAIMPDFAKTPLICIEALLQNSIAKRHIPQYIYGKLEGISFKKRLFAAYIDLPVRTGKAMNDCSLFSHLRDETLSFAFERKNLPINLRKAISQYKNHEMQDFIFEEFCKLSASDLSFIDTIYHRGVLPLFLFYCAFDNPQQLKPFFEGLIHHKQAIKSHETFFLRKLLQYQKYILELDLPKELTQAYLSMVFAENQPHEQIELKMILIQTLISEDTGQNITNLKGAQIKEAVVKMLIEKGFLDSSIPNYIHLFIDKFIQNFRKKDAIFTYVKRFIHHKSMTETIRTFISSVIKDTFILERNQNNSHRKYLTPKELATWEEKEGFILNLSDSDTSFDCLESDNYQDLFLCGTEILGSCLHVAGSGDFNSCLMGYVLDGKISLLAIKNKEGSIIARAVLKLLIDANGKPALLMNKIYPDLTFKEPLLKMAKIKAEKMQIPLYSIYPNKNLAILTSIKCFAPFEYEDGNVLDGSKVTNGKFEVEGFLIDLD